MLVFTCSRCSKRLRVPPEQAGLLGHCPFCHAIVTAPPQKNARKKPPSISVEEVDDDEPLSKPGMKIDPEELIDMTAMVDIVFFLLIFFLVTSMAGVHSSMPTPVPEAKKEGQGAAQAADDSDAGSDVITVRIGRDDSVEVEGIAVADLSDLPTRFQRLRAKGGPHMSLLVIGHGDATHGRAVTVLDAGYEAGMEKVRLSVADQDSDSR